MIKKTIIAISTAACTTLLFYSSSLAEGQGRHHRKGPPKITEIDSNGDNAASLEEFKAFHEKKVEQRFKKADADGDGLVTEEEFKEVRKKFRKKMKKRMHERRENRRERFENDDE